MNESMLFAQTMSQTSPAPETRVSESMQAAGPFSFEFSIALTVLLIVFAVFWLFRQRALLGTSSTVLLALMRTVVVIVAVWMVTQPAWTRTETTTRNAEVVILADASGSMDTIDPVETTLNAQWQQAITAPRNPLSMIERVRLDLKMASRSESMNPALLRRAAEQIGMVRELDPGLADACLASIKEAGSASTELQEEIDRSERLALLASRTDAIESALIDVETFRANLQTSLSIPQGHQPQTRKQYLVDLLSRFEDQVDKDSQASVSLRRAVFAEHVTPMVSGSWQEGLDAASNESSDSRTNVSSALAFVQSLNPSSNLAAVLMLSEGQHNADSQQTPVEVAASLAGTPIFTVPIGNRGRRRDVAIHRVKAPSLVFQEDRPIAEVVVSGYECENDEVVVTLSDGDEVIGTKSVQFPSKASDVAVEFRLPPSRVGRKQYRLDVEALDDESSLQNNNSVFYVETIKSKLFLLIADQQPRWEYRYLEQLFKRDSRVELDKLLIKPRVKSTLSLRLDSTESDATTDNQWLPTTVDGWSKFDVVILGDLPPSVLTPSVCTAMDTWIRGGGNLIAIAGRQSMPAAYRSQPWFDLLPITATPLPISKQMRPIPTLEGATHPSIQLDTNAEENDVLWRRWMSGPVPGYVSPFHSAKPTASVLANFSTVREGDLDRKPVNNRSNRPAWLSVHRVGSGRVAYLASPISYRLRIRAGDQYHHRFWGQLVRWMTTSDLAAGDSMVEIRSDRSIYDSGQRPSVRVRLADASGHPIRGGDVQVELSLDSAFENDGFDRQVFQLIENEQAAGEYQGTMNRLPAGVYQIRAFGPTIDALRGTNALAETDSNRHQTPESIVTFSVEPLGDLEHMMTEANPVLLRQISEASGGLSIPPAALEEVLHVVSLDPQVTETQHVTPLWNRWSNLWIILGCLTTDWWIRRRKGLV